MTRDVPAEEIRLARIAGREAWSAGTGFVHKRELGDGRMIAAYPLLGNGLCVGIGPADADVFDDVWHYQDKQLEAGWRAVLGWDGQGEPEGWYRHPRTGRRRPGGDANKEYVER